MRMRMTEGVLCASCSENSLPPYACGHILECVRKILTVMACCGYCGEEDFVRMKKRILDYLQVSLQGTGLAAFNGEA